jgi:hypothetical protein
MRELQQQQSIMIETSLQGTSLLALLLLQDAATHAQ